MDNRTFDKLAPKHQLAFALGMASRLLGRDQVTTIYERMKPLCLDMIGHSDGDSKQLVGDAPNPADNFWNGVWQIYSAE